MNSWDKTYDGQIPSWVIKLIIGLVTIGVLLFLVRAAMIHYFVQVEVEEFNHTLQSLAARNAQAIDVSRQKELELQRKREELRLKEEVSERFYRKELAWEKFYQKSKLCENPLTTADLAECGNEYMRARKRFEAAWEKQSVLLTN